MLEVFIGQFTMYWQLVLGAILLVIVMAAPEGLDRACFAALRTGLRRGSGPPMLEVSDGRPKRFGGFTALSCGSSLVHRPGRDRHAVHRPERSR